MFSDLGRRPVSGYLPTPTRSAGWPHPVAVSPSDCAGASGSGVIAARVRVRIRPGPAHAAGELLHEVSDRGLRCRSPGFPRWRPRQKANRMSRARSFSSAPLVDTPEHPTVDRWESGPNAALLTARLTGNQGDCCGRQWTLVDDWQRSCIRHGRRWTTMDVRAGIRDREAPVQSPGPRPVFELNFRCEVLQGRRFWPWGAQRGTDLRNC